MAQNIQRQNSWFETKNDVASLFSHFGEFSRTATYREVVQEDAAYHAACRWPLLAEIEGIDSGSASSAIK